MSNLHLCTHDELPAWLKDNGFILTGYRRPGDHEGPQHRIGEDDHIVESLLSGEHKGERHESELKKRGLGNGSAKANGDAKAAQAPFRHDTIAKCWGSVWGYFHNETINIHTHLWGAVFSISLLFLHALHHFSVFPSFLHPLAYHPIFSPPHIPSSLSNPSSSWSSANSSANDWKDTVGFTIFLLSSVTCLTLSSSFHTLSCHSRQLAHKFNKLDYVGIVVMIVGSFLPALHYGFYCRPRWQLAYGSGISLLGAGAAYVVLAPHYATPAYRPIRTAIFLALGLSAVVPVAHGTAIYGVRILDLTMGVRWLALEGVLYVTGALLYALRIPERFARGRFDLLGASHQIFHVFILLAALSHYIALRRAYAFWHMSAFTLSSSSSSSSSSSLKTGLGEMGLETMALDVGRRAVCLGIDSWRGAL